MQRRIQFTRRDAMWRDVMIFMCVLVLALLLFICARDVFNADSEFWNTTSVLPVLQ